jgi:hypothetical protein
LPLPPARRPGRAALGGAALALVVLGAARCGGKAPPAPPAPAEALEAALAPTAAVSALRRAGGGHVHAVTTFKIAPQQPSPEYAPELDAVTTTTDLWMDPAGQFRLLEQNDRDGGREVFLTGRDLAIALRYAKMIRRPAQEPEPTRILEEALGGPFATWELGRRFARVEHADPKARASFRVSLGDKPARPEPEPAPLRRWRDTVAVSGLQGEVKVDPTSGALLRVRLETTFSLVRDGVPFTGIAKVEASLDEMGKVPPIAPPQADELRTRQRTIVEERALLGRAPGEASGSARGTR